jgi:MFS family permease
MSIKPENVSLNSRFVKKSPVYYGWVVLIVGTVGVIMSSPGQTYAFSIFIERFIEDLKLSRSLVSSLYAIGTVTGSLALPYIGRAIDLRGNRKMVVLIALAFGLACLYMGFVQNAAMLLIGVIFMRMLGQSSMTLVSRNVMNQWWVQRRGFVLGISTLVSATLGVGLFPNLINWLIPQVGWRGTYWVLGGLVMGTMIPLGYLFFRERPERYGLLPDGYEPVAEHVVTRKRVVFIEENWTRAEAIRTKAFWLIVVSISAFSMLGTGLTFHIVSIFADNGLSADLAAAIFLPMSLTTSFVSIPAGWLIDRIATKYVLAAGLILLTITILASTSIRGTELAIAYGVIFGLTNGLARIVGDVVYANYFGRTHLGSIAGLSSTMTAIASGLGPLIYGVGRDLAGNYWPSLLLSAIYPATMALLVLFMNRPKH